MAINWLGRLYMAWGGLIVSAGLAFGLSPAQAQVLHAHVHGQADLEVVVLDGQAMVSLISPADTLLGFEHHPQTMTQKKTVEKVRQMLADGTLFKWKQGQACTFEEFDDAELARLLDSHHHTDDHDSHHTHLDLTVSWTYVCNPDSPPKAVEVHLFDSLPALEQLHSAAVDADGQYATSLMPTSRLLKFEAGQ